MEIILSFAILSHHSFLMRYIPAKNTADNWCPRGSKISQGNNKEKYLLVIRRGECDCGGTAQERKPRRLVTL